MIFMLKEFLGWFLIFVFSSFLSAITGIEQAKVFFGVYIVLEIGIALGLIIGNRKIKSSTGTISNSFLLIFTIGMLLIISVFATCIASMLFKVDFFVVYEIIKFGQCLRIENKKKDNE